MTGPDGIIARTSPVLVWILLGLAIAASVTLIALWGRGQVLRGDEWGYAQRLATQSLGHAMLHPPPGKYLVAAPLAYYDLMFHTVGISHYWPYRLSGLALLAVVAALWFVYARRRVGDLVALGAAVLLLFLGAGWEVVASPIRLPSQVAIAAGLGALVALDRPHAWRDIAACLLLTLAVTSHPVSLAFVAAATVIVLSRPADRRWRSIWIVLVPIAVYGLWYLTTYTAPSGETGPSVADTVEFAAKSLAAFCAAATGLFWVPWTPGMHTDFLNPVSTILAILFVGAVVWRLRRPAEVQPTTWAALAALAVLLVAPAFAAGPVRQPFAPRYLYPGVVVLLLVGVELARGLELDHRRRLGVGVVGLTIFAIAMIANVRTLHQHARSLVSSSDQLRVELAVLDLARGDFATAGLPPLGVGVLTQPGVAQPATPGTTNDLQASLLARAARFYYDVRDAFGSPARTPEELLQASPALRSRADTLLAGVLGLEVRPGFSKPSGAAPRSDAAPGVHASHSGSCLSLRPRRGGASDSPALGIVSLPRGGVTIAARRLSDVAVRLGRLSDRPGVPLELPRGRTAQLAVPLDAAAQIPWRLLVLSNDAVTLCGRALS